MYVSTLLTSAHNRTGFTCGNQELDDWFAHSALRDQSSGVSRVMVWTTDDDPQTVAAFFAIAPTRLGRQDAGLSRSFAGGYSVIPAWLLGKLAVSITCQGQGIGTQVLLNAVENIVTLSAKGGGRLIVVDPVDIPVAHWYDARGFISFTDDIPGSRPASRYMRVDRTLRTLEPISRLSPEEERACAEDLAYSRTFPFGRDLWSSP